MMPRSSGLSGPTEPLRVPGHGAEAGEPRRGLRISGRQYRGAGVDPHAHHGPGAGAPHIGADLVEAWGGARCLLHRGRHRHRMGRRRPRTDRGSRQRWGGHPRETSSCHRSVRPWVATPSRRAGRWRS